MKLISTKTSPEIQIHLKRFLLRKEVEKKLASPKLYHESREKGSKNDGDRWTKKIFPLRNFYRFTSLRSLVLVVWYSCSVYRRSESIRKHRIESLLVSCWITFCQGTQGSQNCYQQRTWGIKNNENKSGWSGQWIAFSIKGGACKAAATIRVVRKSKESLFNHYWQPNAHL